jgi:hypothetical protein
VTKLSRPQPIFHIGQILHACHPRELGVLREGKFTAVGRKCLRVDFGPTRGGVFRIHPGHVVGR